MIINVWRHKFIDRHGTPKSYDDASVFRNDDDAIEEIVERTGDDYQFTLHDHESSGDFTRHDYRERVAEYETNQWFDLRHSRGLARVGR